MLHVWQLKDDSKVWEIIIHMDGHPTFIRELKFVNRTGANDCELRFKNIANGMDAMFYSHHVNPNVFNDKEEAYEEAEKRLQVYIKHHKQLLKQSRMILKKMQNSSQLTLSGV